MLDRIDTVDQHPIQNLAIESIGFDCGDPPAKCGVTSDNAARAQRKHPLDANHSNKQRSHHWRQWIYRADFGVFLHGIEARLDAVCRYG